MHTPQLVTCLAAWTQGSAQTEARDRGRQWRAKKCPFDGDHYHVIRTNQPDQTRRRNRYAPIGA